MEALRDSVLINKQSTIIIESSMETSFDYLESIGYVVEKTKEYKTNKHLFIYRGE